MSLRTIVFHISGHGFGHAVRQVEIINALQRAAAGRLRIVVRTSAPAWLFARTVRGDVTWLPADTDVGVVQIDGLRLDAAATMERAAAFYGALPRRIAEEAAVLRTHDASLVIADAPPLACAAASAAGIPAVVCSNFTWDWIYAAYADGCPSAAQVIAEMRRAYAGAIGWRLPFHGGFEAMGVIVDVPLVARRARTDRPRADVRRTLGLPAGVPLVLVSFGGYGVEDLPLDRLDCLDRWGVVVTVRNAEAASRVRGVHTVREDDMYAADLRYEDLVRAVDAVVTKPGYGIVSDCIANGTPVLYTSRGRFAEYDVLVRDMPRYLRCAFLDVERFLEGRWAGGLEALEAAPPAAEPLRTDGAEVVAGMIVEKLGLEQAPETAG